MVYCVNCGTQLSTQWNVCPQCGTKRVDKLSGDGEVAWSVGSVNRLSPEDLSEDGKWYWNGDKWIPVVYKDAHNVTKTRNVKSKGLAYALNFLIPGLGNIYLGNSWGIGIMLIWFVVSTIVLVDLAAWFLFAIIFVSVSCAIVSNDYVRYI